MADNRKSNADQIPVGKTKRQLKKEAKVLEKAEEDSQRDQWVPLEEERTLDAAGLQVATANSGQHSKSSDSVPLAQGKGTDPLGVQVAAESSGEDSKPGNSNPRSEDGAMDTNDIQVVPDTRHYLLSSGSISSGKSTLFSKKESSSSVTTPEPEPPRSNVVATCSKSWWTNVVRVMNNSKLTIYQIECQSGTNLTRIEEKWLVEGFLEHFHIKPCFGRLVFLDRKHFMTINYEKCFDGKSYCGTFERIYTGGEHPKMVWSKLTNHPRYSVAHEIQPAEDPPGNPAALFLASFEAYASCLTVNRIDFTKIDGNASEIQAFASACERSYIPQNPILAVRNSLASEQSVIHGNRIFDFTLSGLSIGFGLECRTGTFSRVRPCSDGLVKIVAPCHRVFYAPMKLSSFIAAHKPDFAMDSGENIKELGNVLRGLRIKIKQANGSERLTTINGVTSTCPSDTIFRLADGSQSSVEDYFAGKRLVTLTGVDQPCVNIGSVKRLQHFPTSVCDIMPGQSFGKSLPPQAQVKFDKLRASEGLYKNDTKAEQIDCGQSTENPSSKRFLRTVGQAEICRVLPQAHHVSANGLTKVECVGLSTKMKVPEKLEKQKHRFILFLAQVGNGPSLSRSIGAFTSILQKKAKAQGMGALGPTFENCTLKLSDTDHQWKNHVENMIDRPSDGEDHIPMVLTIIDNGETIKRAYQKVKSSFRIENGFESTCISTATLEKAHSKDADNGLDKYASALLHKVHAKAQGHSSADPDTRSTGLHDTKHNVILVGFHVAHLPVQNMSVGSDRKSECNTSAVNRCNKTHGSRWTLQDID